MSFITDIFGGGSQQSAPPPVPPPPPPVPPVIEDAGVKSEQDADAFRRRQGRASTVLSGNSNNGSGTGTPSVGTKTLLGS